MTNRGNRNCIYIPSIDAKDLYLANNFVEGQNDIGYSLTTQSGEVNFNKYINTLDFSLDLLKLREIAGEIYKKGKYKKDKHLFSFVENGKEYSNKVINVTFKYSIKAFNKVANDIYVKQGYDLRQLKFSNCIAYDSSGGHIVGIITNQPVEMEHLLYEDELPNKFAIGINDDAEYIYTTANQKTTVPVEDLRRKLYVNGFVCNGVKYVRFKRSSGSARVGKCLFIDERLYDKFHEWEMCGLDIKEGDNVDLAALESYLSLSSSSAIDLIDIKPENILVIPDFDSKFKERAVIVEYGSGSALTTREGYVDICNSIFDGQSMIDRSIMGRYKDKGMILIRNRFFKSCCFNTNLQKWFFDNNIKSISDLHSEAITMATDIKQIKLVTTPNSIKYLKFASIEKWLSEIDSIFSIVKYEKKTRFFDGKLVQAHYQLLNTLQLNEADAKELLKDSLDYLDMLNTDTDVFKHHVKCSISDYIKTNAAKDKNELAYMMMNLSDTFFKTKMFRDFKRATCKSYLSNLRKGHVLIDGNYSVLFGNPFEMLLHSIGKLNESTISSLQPGCVHTTRYEYDKYILQCRSPHISMSNILISKNVEHEMIDKYFNLTSEIISVNAINENLLETLSGADYDSDSTLITDNEILLKAAIKNNNVFPVPANHVEAEKIDRVFSNCQKADLDHRTSNNKIGEVINLSQELNTIIWHTVNNSNNQMADLCYEKILAIYHDVCILNICSMVEIDKAKREFKVSVDDELKKIRKRWLEKIDSKTVKPAFLDYISATKGFNNNTTISKYFDTSMDYIIKQLNQYRSPRQCGITVPFSDCFDFDDFDNCKVNRRQLNSIISMCYNMRGRIANLYNGKFHYTQNEKALLTQNYKEALIHEVSNMKITPHTLLKLLTVVDCKEHSTIRNTLFDLLFTSHNNSVIDLINNVRPSRSYIEKNDNGELSLYGVRFKKQIA